MVRAAGSGQAPVSTVCSPFNGRARIPDTARRARTSTPAASSRSFRSTLWSYARRITTWGTARPTGAACSSVVASAALMSTRPASRSATHTAGRSPCVEANSRNAAQLSEPSGSPTAASPRNTPVREASARARSLTSASSAPQPSLPTHPP